MAILHTRDGHSFSTQYHQTRQGWDYCSSRSYCKWPVIAGIVVGLLVIALSLFCCLKCCCGCFGGRGRKKNQQQGQSFIPAPYLGYQNANNNVAPPAYGQQPAQYAHFDNNRKVTEDTLPHMPSWSEARDHRVEDHSQSYQASNVELSNLQKPALASSNVHLPPQESGVTEAESRPYAQRAPSSYTGPDFGAATSPAMQHHQPLPQQHDHQPYTGPDFSTPPSQNAYTAYAPSQSTKYEPTFAELGDTQSHTGYQGAQQPGSLQAGRTR